MKKRNQRMSNRIRKLLFECFENRVMLDGSGPRILSITPTEVRNAAYDHVDVTFNTNIDTTSFTTSDVKLDGPSGSIAVSDISPLTAFGFRIQFAPLTVRGDYQVVIGPDVLDLVGNPMNQDNDSTNGEATEDQFRSSLRLILADVIFNSNTTISENNRQFDNKSIVIDGAMVLIDGPHRFTAIHVVNGGKVSHTPNSATETHKLDLTVDEQMIVDSTSQIDVTGMGYLRRRTKGNTTIDAANGESGGSYGGLGADFRGTTNAVYGDYLDPDEWGSGSARGDVFGSDSSGAGGGLVRIVAASLNLDGQLLANGVNGGSGGSIYISVTNLTGSGSIKAAGGNGAYDVGAGGGGGRIAVYFKDSSTFNLSKIVAPGGTTGEPIPGGAGTVFVLNGVPLTHVRSRMPTGINGGFVQSLSSVDLEFNRTIDLELFTLSQFSIEGQMHSIIPNAITHVSDRTYRIWFSPLAENGIYHFSLSSTLVDADGLQLDQNANGIPGEQGDGYQFDLIVDSIPPKAVGHSPDGDLAGTISSIDVFFSETIDKATLSTADTSIMRPDGSTIAATSITEVGFNRFRITFASQTLVGTYHVKVGPDVRDRAGNELDQDRDGIFGEAGDDVYDATFNLVPVNLGLNALVVNTDPLWAGENISLSWQGANLTGTQLVGEWTDGVYLSTDAVWDINDIRLTTVQHTGGLAAGANYSGAATAVLPGVLPGNYRILVRADITNQEKETNEADNLVSTPVTVGVHSLQPTGVQASGSLTISDRTDYYAFKVNQGENAAVVLQGLTAGSSNELYVSLEAIPTRLDYDFRSVKDETFLDHKDQSLAFTAPLGGGTYYVLVYGDVTNPSSDYKISASKGDFVVTTISPDKASNRAPGLRDSLGKPVGRVIPTEVTLEGAGFDENTTVEFISTNGTSYSPETTNLISARTITLEVEPTLWPVGVYNVRIRKGNTTSTRPAAFTVVQNGVPNLETNVVLPSAIASRALTPQTIWIEYRNTGTAPMLSPLLRLDATSTQNARITADRNLAFPYTGYANLSPSITDSVQVLAKGSGATPGILQPGDSGRIPIYYFGLDAFGHFGVTFSLSTLTADDVTWSSSTTSTSRVEQPPGSGHWVFVNTTTTIGENWLIDWSSIATQSRPEAIPVDAWNAIVANLQADIGTEWGQYVEALASDINVLHKIGYDSTNVDQLWNFEIAQASASLNPVATLAGAVDAAVDAPGLSLSFTRVFGQSILARYRQGTLGRGWTTNWDIHADVFDNGDVVLRGPGGVDRFFTKKKGGSYQNAPGDHGVLTLSGGAYRLTEVDKSIWQFRSDGLLDFVQDTNSNKITLAYNATSQLISITHSSGQQLLIAYNSAGHIASVTNPYGPGTVDDRITTYQYDATSEHLIQVTAPGNRITSYAYNTTGESRVLHTLTSVAYADGSHDLFAYDNRGRLIQTSRDAGAQKVTYTYDADGGVSVTDATDRATHLAYGLGGQIAQVRDAQGRIVNFAFDKNLQFTQVVGPSGEKYKYTYDSQGNVTGVTDPMRQGTSFRYDTISNRLVGFTDARGNGIGYTYDANGNLTRITYQDATHEDFTYDAKGNVLTSKNRRSQTLTYTYNAAGQVLTKDDSTTSGVDYHYTYDAFGNLTTASDPSGTMSMTYDPATDLMTRITYPGGQFFTFEYDSVGRRTKRTDQDGHVENSFYDSVGRLEHMTDEHDALIVRYEFDPSGRLATKTLGNGVYTKYDYDAAGNILHLVNFKPDNSVLSRFDYTYDTSGRRISMTTLDDTQTYGYDAIGQLTSVTYANGRVVQYVYDTVGNRVKTADNGIETLYTTNALNQYVTAGGVTFTYDLDGNMISKTENEITVAYTYSTENQVVGVATPTENWNYLYDGFGNRIATIHNGVKNEYLIDPAGLGNVAAEYTGAGTLLARYDYGFGLASRVTENSQPEFYTFSALGHTSEITNANGGIINQYAYDPFGESLRKNETLPNQFEFVGEYGVMHEGNGLQFMRARYYSAEIGRFLQTDPLGISGDPSLYRYSRNSPVERIDPLGLLSIPAPNPLIPPRVPRVPLNLKPTAPNKSIDDFIDELIEEKRKSIDECVEAILSGNDAEVFKQCFEQPDPPDPPKPPDGQIQKKKTTTVQSADPNDKLGPAGSSTSRYVLPIIPLSYQIQFENKPDATAPAQQVIIIDRLDDDLDLDSLQLADITFANQSLSIPVGLDHYEAQVPFNSNGTEIIVNVSASLNRSTRELSLTLQVVDPATGTFPENPLVGILYPEDGTGRGSGSISYSIRPLPGLPSGTTIDNRARIVFDLNDPIDTPLAHNTLDAATPTSHVEPLPASQTATTMTLNWSGTDEANGSGIASYDIYVAVDSNPFALWLEKTTTTAASATVQPGHTYSFYSVATDNVGHREATPSTAQASVYVLSVSWQQSVVATDVNDDGFVTAIDALLIINRLNNQTTAILPTPTIDLHPAPYFDVNGDGFVTAIDALLVINRLNNPSTAEGESRSVALPNWNWIESESMATLIASDRTRFDKVEEPLSDDLLELLACDVHEPLAKRWFRPTPSQRSW